MSVLADSVLAADIQAPKLDYAALSPMLILLGGACVGMLFEAFVPRRGRHWVQVIFTLLVLVASFVAVVVEAGRGDHLPARRSSSPEASFCSASSATQSTAEGKCRLHGVDTSRVTKPIKTHLELPIWSY